MSTTSVRVLVTLVLHPHTFLTRYRVCLFGERCQHCLLIREAICWVIFWRCPRRSRYRFARYVFKYKTDDAHYILSVKPAGISLRLALINPVLRINSSALCLGWIGLSCPLPYINSCSCLQITPLFLSREHKCWRLSWRIVTLFSALAWKQCSQCCFMDWRDGFGRLQEIFFPVLILKYLESISSTFFTKQHSCPFLILFFPTSVQFNF